MHRFPHVPLSFGSKVMFYPLRDKSESVQKQMLFWDEPDNSYPESDMVLIKAVRKSNNGKNNLYRAHMDDLLHESERWRGVRKCCVLCKKACPT